MSKQNYSITLIKFVTTDTSETVGYWRLDYNDDGIKTLYFRSMEMAKRWINNFYGL